MVDHGSRSTPPGAAIRGVALLLAGATIARAALHPGLAGRTLGETVPPVGLATALAALAIAAWIVPRRGRTAGAVCAALVLGLAAFELFTPELPRRRGVALLASGTAAACVALGAHAALGRSKALRTLLVAVGATAALWLVRPLLLPPSGLVRASASPSAPARWDDRRAIVLITMDTTRRDALGCYGAGSEATPHLDAFARRATRYTNASSTSPFTAPSMASLLSAQDPLDHRCVTGSPDLDPSVTTLAEHCDKLGLATAGFLDNPWLGEEFGLARGYRTLWRDTELGDVEAWLDENGARPFLLHVHLFMAHGPYDLRPEHALPLDIDAESDAARAIGPTVDARTIQRGEVPTHHGFDAAGIAWLRDVQRTEVRAQDAWIGGLLDALEARGLTERTVVAITSDHGEEFGDRGGLHHSHTLFGELVDVPLLVASPGAPARVEEAPTSLRALPQLLLEASGWPVPEALQPPEGSEVRSIRLRQGGRHLARLVEGDHVLHLRVTPGGDGAPDTALFSRDTDPGETRDLSDQRQRFIGDWLARPATGKLVERLRATPIAADPGGRPLSGWTRRQLRALGYAR